MAYRRAPLYCSFCGKANSEVACIVAGPTVFICDECVELCAEIVAERKAAHREKVMHPGDLGLPA